MFVSPGWNSDVGQILRTTKVSTIRRYFRRCHAGSRQLRKSRSDPRLGIKSLESVVSSSEVTVYVLHLDTPEISFRDQRNVETHSVRGVIMRY